MERIITKNKKVKLIARSQSNGMEGFHVLIKDNNNRWNIVSRSYDENHEIRIYNHYVKNLK